MDAPARVISEYTHEADGPPPYDFRFVIDPSKFDERMRYGLRARIEHDGELLFTSTEHIDPFGGEAGEPIEIMVTRVGGGPPAAPGDAPGPDASLTDTDWRLEELNGAPAQQGAGEKMPSLFLSEEGNRAGGFSGCNDFTGSYRLDGKALGFGPLAATMKACMVGMEQEQAILQALGNVASFSIEGDGLALMAPDGTVLMRFRAGAR
jgi:putative lipoprotein